MKLKLLIIILLILLIPPAYYKLMRNEKREIFLLYLKQRAIDFSRKYQGEDVIVVSKGAHLLYYCRNGQIVTNERWRGFTFNFPVPIALASSYYKTPEGEMFIEDKNPNSRYIKFLHFSYPGAYGLHSGPTYLASYFDKMERLDPDFSFVTKKDDTRGCVAVENRVIKYLFANVDVKTPVLILP